MVTRGKLESFQKLQKTGLKFYVRECAVCVVMRLYDVITEEVAPGLCAALLMRHNVELFLRFRGRENLSSLLIIGSTVPAAYRIGDGLIIPVVWSRLGVCEVPLRWNSGKSVFFEPKNCSGR